MPQFSNGSPTGEDGGEAGSDSEGSQATPVAVITGASSGIGAATALRLSKEGFSLVIGARRVAALEDIAQKCDGPVQAYQLDVRDPSSIASFCTRIPAVDVLVNNAGLARRMERIEAMDDESVVEMWETNVLGVLRMTRALLPLLHESSSGHIVNVGSTAGVEVYPGGGGYTSSKHALRALTRTLRLELIGRPIRITEVAPGLVETEFSLVRFEGDEAKAKKPYEGITPLTADDVADAVAWAVTRPPHVDIDEIVMRPVAQANSTMVSRAGDRPA